jgi:aldehyde:ferredoxin oxidoreductase
MSGYTGKIAFINLSSRKIEEEQLPEKIYRDYLGGVGIGAKVLYERMQPDANPLGPENIIGFIPGLLTGTPVPMTSKFSIVAKSPLTNTWGDTNSGGLFSSELKSAGYDALFFTGKSDKPVYALITNNTIELKDATHIWGKTTSETVEIIRTETGDSKLKIACIGPSGELKALIASVVTDEQRVAGRSGIGAVMGSKRLKAVAVHGTGKMKVADSERVKQLSKDTIPLLRDYEHLPFMKMLHDTGTCNGLQGGIPMGNAPIRNWSLKGPQAFPEFQNLAAPHILKYQIKRAGCGNCPINCGGILSMKKNSHTIQTRQPEYETMAAFGSMLLNSDPDTIILANNMCDEYGIDTISAGTVIAFAMECYENGIINKDLTSDIELTWGNTKAIMAILEKIVTRRGFGSILADGVRKAAVQIGRNSEQYAMHVHGQELGYHDPRFNPARGLGYISNATPGRHMVSAAAMRLEGQGNVGPYPEIKKPDIEDQWELRGHIGALATSYSQAFQGCGVCLFALGGGTQYPLIDFINAVTGWNLSAEEVINSGKRVLTLRQAFNIRDGLRSKEFNLPKRLIEPAPMGPTAGKKLNFNAMKASFNKAMKWGEKSGIPSAECLRELGLDTIVRL